MHQKSTSTLEPMSATFHNDEDDDDDIDVKDPFADGEDDLDDDDDDALGDGRGSWWRGVVTRRVREDEARDSDDDDDNDDDEEFGDFAMAEDDKGRNREEAAKVVLKPLAVNPAKEGNRGLSGLWPFGTKSEKDREKQQQDDDNQETVETSTITEKAPEAVSQPSAAVELKEAQTRTSIEEPDEEEVVVEKS
jgi:SIT4-associating protein SAP185/190